jgi:hypothetical protein
MSIPSIIRVGIIAVPDIFSTIIPVSRVAVVLEVRTRRSALLHNRNFAGCIRNLENKSWNLKNKGSEPFYSLTFYQQK